VHAAWSSGMPKAEAARSFMVGISSSVKRYGEMAEEGRSLAFKKAPGRESTLG
jgi:transposase